MEEERRQAADADALLGAPAPPAEDVVLVSPMPPADSAEPSAAEKRRSSIDAMVSRCLDPAMGLCLAALDPHGSDPVASDDSRNLVMRALADCARKRVAHDDESVRAVMARVAELAMEALVARSGSARLPEQVDLATLLPGEVAAEEVAPNGWLPFAVLQDAVAATRLTDRQVAFVVLAATVAPSDAAVLLGMDLEDVYSSLHRIGRRLGEGHAGPSARLDVA